MKMKVFTLILSLAVLLSAQQAASIRNQQVNQKNRIRQGVKSGELTRHETKVLIKEQRKIQKTKVRAAGDGIITKREKAKISSMQKAASKDIYRKKHNNRKP